MTSCREWRPCKVGWHAAQVLSYLPFETIGKSSEFHTHFLHIFSTCKKGTESCNAYLSLNTNRFIVRNVSFANYSSNDKDYFTICCLFTIFWVKRFFLVQDFGLAFQVQLFKSLLPCQKRRDGFSKFTTDRHFQLLFNCQTNFGK